MVMYHGIHNTVMNWYHISQPNFGHLRSLRVHLLKYSDICISVYSLVPCEGFFPRKFLQTCLSAQNCGRILIV